MATPSQPGRITITVLDQGYFKKSFHFKLNTNVKKVLDRYLAYLCPECTKPELVEFWYETTKLENQTAKILGMQDGDIIDVRIREQCTRGACPVPPGQTLPNIHYVAEAAPTGEQAIQESQQAPEGPERLTFSVRDVNSTTMTLRMRKDTRMMQAMQAFAHHVQKEVKECRFLVGGRRLSGTETLETLEMEENDQVDVHYEQIRGYEI
ncbi:hypothetical protein LTR85_008235 [Meristemomyces frigidus]|nr:hypothetical protein LTR85_008235 [Meristemomyces frigidus]